MPGLTVPSDYPYPLPTDPVRDGAAKIQELAEWIQKGPPEIQAYRSSSWTMAVGWSKVTNWSGTKYVSPTAGAAGMGIVSAGISVPAGRYSCVASLGFPVGDGSVRRLYVVPSTQAAALPDDVSADIVAPATASHPTRINLTTRITLAAAATLTVGVYTNGSAQAISTVDNLYLCVTRTA